MKIISSMYRPQNWMCSTSVAGSFRKTPLSHSPRKRYVYEGMQATPIAVPWSYYSGFPPPPLEVTKRIQILTAAIDFNTSCAGQDMYPKNSSSIPIAKSEISAFILSHLAMFHSHIETFFTQW